MKNEGLFKLYVDLAVGLIHSDTPQSKLLERTQERRVEETRILVHWAAEGEANTLADHVLARLLVCLKSADKEETKSIREAVIQLFVKHIDKPG